MDCHGSPWITMLMEESKLAQKWIKSLGTKQKWLKGDHDNSFSSDMQFILGVTINISPRHND